MTNLYTFYLALFICTISNFGINAQEKKPLNPIILDQPENWRYEKIDFPLDFAPNLPYKGFEELRFAPGMFDRKSESYFTYVFAIALYKEKKLSKKQLNEFLIEYYQGLSAAVAKSKKTNIDISKITVETSKADKSGQYQSTVNFLDTFNNGEEVLLNMEIELIPNKNKEVLYLMAIVSPKNKDNKIWEELRQIRQKVKF